MLRAQAVAAVVLATVTVLGVAPGAATADGHFTASVSCVEGTPTLEATLVASNPMFVIGSIWRYEPSPDGYGELLAGFDLLPVDVTVDVSGWPSPFTVLGLQLAQDGVGDSFAWIELTVPDCDDPRGGGRPGSGWTPPGFERIPDHVGCPGRAFYRP